MILRAGGDLEWLQNLFLCSRERFFEDKKTCLAVIAHYDVLGFLFLLLQHISFFSKSRIS